jgi:hypothetical protein
MLDNEKHSTQRDEIKSYMDKSFQASFGYFAAIFAFLTLGDTLSKAPYFVGLQSIDVISVAILLTSLSYLILISSCLFAIQKRIYFILCTGPSYDYEWEVFSQEPTAIDCQSTHVKQTSWVTKKERDLSWKFDSYFVAPFLFIICAIAGFAIIKGCESSSKYIISVTSVLTVAYILPAWMIARIRILNSKCNRLAKSHLSTLKETANLGASV